MDRRIINKAHSEMSRMARTEEKFVYYSDVIRLAGIGHLGGGALENALGQVFYEVNQYDWSQDTHRPMLSAIAISSQSQNPSDGFYRLARGIGRLTSKNELDELGFWVKELEALRSYWQDRSETTFSGVNITYQAVAAAIETFDETYPNPETFDHWLTNDGYKYALEYDGKLFPPKHILSIVAGIDVSRFSGGEQTNRVFQQLGFVIVDKPNIASEITHNTYLLTWNPSKFAWADFQEDWEAIYVGSRPRLRWSCGNTKQINIGDRVFLMRLGYREKVTGIVASGVVTQRPFEASHWNEEGKSATALYIEFEPDVLLNAASDELFDPQLVSRDFNWHPQSSGVTIPNDAAAYLEKLWQQHIQQSQPNERSTDQNESKTVTYLEGSRKLIYGYRYERDPRAREACVQHFGPQCVICGFDFGEAYGEVGEGYIHVHHLIPISERESEYTIDPIQELRPVCPNCHAMLHRTSPPYSIEELQYILEQQAAKRRRA